MTDNYTCDSTGLIFRDDTPPPPFRNSWDIVRSHTMAVRFGHSNEISGLFTSSSEASDYLQGMLASSILIFFFFLSWITVLLVFKCLGYKLVAFFSGRRLERPKRPQPKVVEDDQEEFDNEMQGEVNKEVVVEDNEESEGVEIDAIMQEELQKDLVLDKEAFEGDVEGDTEMMQSVSPPQDLGESGNGNEDDIVKNGIIDDDDDDDYNDDDYNDDDYAEQMKPWEAEVEKVEERMRRIRIALLCCGVAILICVILTITKGVESFVGSLDNSRKGIAQAQWLAEQAIVLVDNYVGRQKEASNEVGYLGLNWTTACPTIRDKVCYNTTDDTCDYADLFSGDEIDAFYSYIEGNVFDQLSDFRSDLVELIGTFENLDKMVDNFYWAFIVAACFAGIIGVLDIVLMYGIIAAWRHKLHGSELQMLGGIARHYIVLPMFIFSIVISWIFSMVFIIGSIMSADFCYNSPDTFLTSWLNHNKDDFSSTIFDFAIYYIGGCKPDDIPVDLESASEALLNASLTVSNIAERVANANITLLHEVCGPDSDPDMLSGAAVLVAASICNLATALFEIREYFSCDNWYPVYATVMYNSVCYDGNQGFSWIATTQFFIVLFAMLMLTLRVGFYEIAEEGEEVGTRHGCGCCYYYKSDKAIADTLDNQDEMLGNKDTTLGNHDETNDKGGIESASVQSMYEVVVD
mmetsp:Transcript_10501/g.19140  ORF Transcript_10501/g.19140 Transcript_10501/m.19140 type:complete len:690 (-) Transcript_10501:177-2246(-)